MPTRFHWLTFDVADLLPHHWQRDVIAVAAAADFRNFPPTPGLTREMPAVRSIPRGRVHAEQVRLQLPWLYELYHGHFLDLINGAWDEPVVTAADDRYGVVLNVQRGSFMRFECHVDSNPLSGVLFCTDHPKGGELCVAHDPAASDLASIERDCSVIRPHAGHLIFFDGRAHAHYARPLDAQSGLRVAAVMNYYTESFPESTRPGDLNRHLYGDPDLSVVLSPHRGIRDAGGAVADPLYRRIAQDLMRKIESGELEPGARLPNEVEFREEYEASRNTIRDAIKWLTIRGLVEIRPGRGTFVVQKIDPFVTTLSEDPDTGMAGGEGVAAFTEINKRQQQKYQHELEQWEQAHAEWEQRQETRETAGTKASRNEQDDDPEPVRPEVPMARASTPTVEVRFASDYVAERLRINVGDEVLVRHQEFYVGRTPWSLQTTFYPMDLVDRGATGSGSWSARRTREKHGSSGFQTTAAYP